MKNSNRYNIVRRQTFAITFCFILVLSAFGATTQDNRLHEAARWGNIKEVNRLLDEGLAVDEVCESNASASYCRENWTPLYAAARYGHSSVIERLIQAGASIESKSGSGRSPLMEAVERGYVNAVSVLIDAGADVNVEYQRASWGLCSMLHAALLNGTGVVNYDIVKMLLEAGARTDMLYGHQDGAKRMPIHYLASWSLPETFKLVLDYTTDINCVDADGWTPLHHAAKANQIQNMGLLLERGACVEMTDASGRTPLHYAASAKTLDEVNELIEGVKLLLQNGASVHCKDKHGVRPLHFSANSKFCAVALILIESGANLHEVDDLGRTALHYAAKGGYSMMVELLLEKGAAVNKIDYHKKMPLDYALSSKGHGGYWSESFAETINVLLAAGALVYPIRLLRPEHKNNYLRVAIHAGFECFAKVLIDVGVDTNRVDENGNTPLHDAARRGQAEIVALLISAGVDQSIRNCTGRTALDEACKNKQHEIAALFQNSPSICCAQSDDVSETLASSENSESSLALIVVPEKLDGTINSVRTLPCVQGTNSLEIEKVMGLVIRGDVPSILECIEAGMSPDLSDHEGKTLLHRAVLHGHEELALALLEAGAEIDAPVCKGEHAGKTPLHCAVVKKMGELAEEFLRRGACVNTQDNLEQSPLHEAVCQLQIDTMLTLLLYGARVDVRDALGKTPLYYAKQSGVIGLDKILEYSMPQVKMRQCIECNRPLLEGNQELVSGRCSLNHVMHRECFQKYNECPLCGERILYVVSDVRFEVEEDLD